MLILDKINKEFNYKYDFLRVLHVEYNTLLSCCDICFLYPENKNITDEDKEKIIEFVNSEFKLNCTVKIKFKKSYLDENLIKKNLISYLKKSNASMFAYLNDEDILISVKDTNVNINFTLAKELYDYFVFNNLKENILKFLNDNFIANFFIDLKENNNIPINENDLYQRSEKIIENLPQQKKVKRYKVYNVEKIIGAEIEPMPEYICNQPEEKNSVILAGVINNLNEKTYVSRRTKRQGKNDLSFYYTFELSDFNAKIQSIYFSNKTTYKKAKLLKNGDKILVVGNIKKDRRDKTLNIKSISFCEIEKDSEIVNQEENDCHVLHIQNYNYVNPKPFILNEQENFFDKKKEYKEIITSNQFVVFDVETTGLNPFQDEIIEIGAVKIVNGNIIEQFQTLIHPQNEIPEEITNITTITNDMVKDSPDGEKVILDFYKFCENCILVGYNISFDYAFISNLIKKVGLSFDNELIDALVLAKEKLYLPRYKLINVVEALKLKLNNAHRALADAVATAQVFLKLNEI